MQLKYLAVFCLLLPASLWAGEDARGQHNWTYLNPDGWPAGYNKAQGIDKRVEKAAKEYDKAFFERLEATVPEGQRNLEHLASDQQANIFLGDCVDACEVSITFLDEGTSFQSSLGFFTYDPQNPPQSRSDVSQETIFFPNMSLPGSGGAFHAGSRLSLGEFNSSAEQPLAIGFVLVVHGFEKQKGVKDPHPGDQIFYSLSHLNTETDESLRQHAVAFRDAPTGEWILGMEDRRRDQGADEDFNDFLVGIRITGQNQNEDPDDGDVPQDSDGDGVDDHIDAFPEDFERASVEFISPYSLAFEDLWPSRGDYDMNDLVVEELVRVHRSADGMVKDLIILQNYVARGAANENGYSLQLSSVSRADVVNAVQIPLQNAPNLSLSEKDISVYTQHQSAESLGLEDDASGVVLGLHRALRQVLPAAGGEGDCALFTNSVTSCTHREPVRYLVAIEFNAGQDILNGNLAALNPFLWAGSREHEIHLAEFAATRRMDTALFGTKDDDSQPNQGRYYKTKGNLPWALRIPWQTTSTDILTSFNNRSGAWAWPQEEIEIFETYPKFATWATSNGRAADDWYYRSNAISANVYQPGN